MRGFDMSCGAGGCAIGGCAIGESRTTSPENGRGSVACGNGGCGGGEAWDGTYRDVVGLKLGNHAKTFYFDSTGFDLAKGDTCISEADDGEIFGVVVQPTGASQKFTAIPDMKKVLRRARSSDLDVNRRNASLRRDVLEYCKAKVKDLRLEMKVIDVEPAFDGRRLTCYFTAEERVDFRELVRDMAHRYRRRIEMRQIGARDEAKMRGGFGICGRPLCCSTFMTEFAPISVKMAKRQGLSLNPSKISGLCGRLMCCLRFEDRDLPKPATAEEPGNRAAAATSSSGGGYSSRSSSASSRAR
jgi:cell fate regulator YaaT (PSP1 superfamily)